MTHKLNERQLIFVKEYAAHGDGRMAAERAGYAGPSASASQLLQNDSVIDAIVRAQSVRTLSLQPLAHNTLEDVMKHGKGAPRVIAAKIILDRADRLMEQKQTKELHEMSPEELRARLAEVQRQRSDAAKIIDGEVNAGRPVPEPTDMSWQEDDLPF